MLLSLRRAYEEEMSLHHPVVHAMPGKVKSCGDNTIRSRRRDPPELLGIQSPAGVKHALETTGRNGPLQWQIDLFQCVGICNGGSFLKGRSRKNPTRGAIRCLSNVLFFGGLKHSKHPNTPTPSS